MRNVVATLWAAQGRAAARIIARQAAKTIDGLSHPWAEAAVALALNGRKPRVTGVAPAVELAQLTRALSRAGLVLILEPAEPYHTPAALVRALEWIAQNAPVAVVAIFPHRPVARPTASAQRYRAAACKNARR